MTDDTIHFDGSRLSIANIVDIARQRAGVNLSNASDFVQRINKGAQFLDSLWKEEGVIYGVTTGYGDSCSVRIPNDLVEELPRHLFSFHGCGLGAIFDEEQTRAILAVRLASLCYGYSGVRHDLLRQLATLLRFDLLPRIPQEGSVGASGDLTPMSYVAAVLAGERQVIYQGQLQDTARIFNELDIAPLKLYPKEALAIMNGTPVMTALACLAIDRAAYLCRLCSRITSFSSIALMGNAYHFDPLLFSVKPHPGQNQVAAWIHEDLNVGDAPRNSQRLQDRYSLRCAPHVIGVAMDALEWMKAFVENELNSANDNPIVDGEGGHVLHGGHFYGGHIAFAMDSLKNAIANLADLLDRQMAQLVDEKFNHGLPANITAAEGERLSLNHGFKAVQIGVSAWTAEALKQTMPASVFSRSTECHNQDKVSMGTIAARDCMRVIELTEQVAAASLLAAWQGVQLRLRSGEITTTHFSDDVRGNLDDIANHFQLVTEDRPLEDDLRRMMTLIKGQHWDLFA